MGMNKGGFSTVVFPEAKKPISKNKPKINIRMSSILISMIFPSDKVPAEKLGEKAIAPAKKIKDKILIASLKFIFKFLKKSILPTPKLNPSRSQYVLLRKPKAL